MKCKDCLHFDPWVIDYVGKDKKPFRHMLGNFGERGDKGRCKPDGELHLEVWYGKKLFVFGEDESCDQYKPREGEMF